MDIKDTIIDEVTEKIEDLAADHADMIEKMPDALVDGAEDLLAKVGIDVDLNGDESANVVSDDTDASDEASDEVVDEEVSAE
jgi:hypothetical protein